MRRLSVCKLFWVRFRDGQDVILVRLIYPCSRSENKKEEGFSSTRVSWSVNKLQIAILTPHSLSISKLQTPHSTPA